jgi:hypothetical protein
MRVRPRRRQRNHPPETISQSPRAELRLSSISLSTARSRSHVSATAQVGRHGRIAGYSHLSLMRTSCVVKRQSMPRSAVGGVPEHDGSMVATSHTYSFISTKLQLQPLPVQSRSRLTQTSLWRWQHGLIANGCDVFTKVRKADESVQAVQGTFAEIPSPTSDYALSNGCEMTPRAAAQTPIWVRDVNPSLAMMCSTCAPTVRSVTIIRSAIWRFVSP